MNKIGLAVFLVVVRLTAPASAQWRPEGVATTDRLTGQTTSPQYRVDSADKSAALLLDCHLDDVFLLTARPLHADPRYTGLPLRVARFKGTLLLESATLLVSPQPNEPRLARVSLVLSDDVNGPNERRLPLTILGQRPRPFLPWLGIGDTVRLEVPAGVGGALEYVTFTMTGLRVCAAK
jgi:hypothetical protein